MADINVFETSDIVLDEGRLSPDHYRNLEGRILLWGIICGALVMWLYRTYGDFGFWLAFPFWTAFAALCYGWITSKARRARDLGYSGMAFWSAAGGLALVIFVMLFFSGSTFGSAVAMAYAVVQMICLALFFAQGQKFDSRFGAYPPIYTETPLMQVVGWSAIAFYVAVVGYIVAVQAGLAEERIAKAIGPLPFMEGVADVTYAEWSRIDSPVQPVAAPIPTPDADVDVFDEDEEIFE